MSSLIGLKNPDWDRGATSVEVLESWSLMKTPGPVLVILASYLLFVLRAGPQYMRKRDPMKLTIVLVLYNAVQVALSVFLTIKYMRHLMKHGLLHSKCLMHEDHTRIEMLDHIWWYFAAKVTELLDTVFFVLRKKNSQVTFLHVYHHAMMMGGTWAYLKYFPTDNSVFIGMANSLIHVLMYTYYGLAAFGPSVAKYLTWKKYMTTLQLVQFVSMLGYYFISIMVSECPPSKAITYFFIFNIVLFFCLFTNFYIKNYKQKREKANRLQ